MIRRSLLGVALAALCLGEAVAQAPVTLFKVIGPRDEVVIGMTAAELERLGTGPAVERVARALVGYNQLTVWRYSVGRAPDGSTRFVANGRIAILRHDTVRIEPYAAALPVMPPPTE